MPEVRRYEYNRRTGLKPLIIFFLDMFIGRNRSGSRLSLRLQTEPFHHSAVGLLLDCWDYLTAHHSAVGGVYLIDGTP